MTLKRKSKIEIPAHYYKVMLEIIKSVFAAISCKVFLFGSRANGKNAEVSDIDIGIQSTRSIEKEILILKEKLFESTIPYEVDVIDMSAADNFWRKASKRHPLKAKGIQAVLKLGRI